MTSTIHMTAQDESSKTAKICKLPHKCGTTTVQARTIYCMCSVGVL